MDANERDPNGDHRHLGQVMDLFHLEEHSPGMVFWHPDGWAMFRTIETIMRRTHEAHGYREVRTPQILSRTLWEQSGHWGKFRSNMSATGELDTILDCDGSPVDQVSPEYAVKPMSCPGHVAVFDHTRRSYRELPYRVFEMGVVHRNESSGSLSGIMRLRQFTQDDAHIFCTEDQIGSETANYMAMLRKVYERFGFTSWTVKLSTRPEVRAGDDAVWDRAEAALVDACKAVGVDYEIQPGEGAFYGPKLEFTLFDALGRPWQCGTIQVDFVLPERFDLSFIGEDGTNRNPDGTPRRPVILHHAVLGSLERFIAILLEHHRGILPLDLAPVQVVVASISEKSAVYAATVHEVLHRYGIRAELDVSADKVGAKIRLHSGRKVACIAVVGEREAETNEVSVRRLGKPKAVQMDRNDLFNAIHNAVEF